MIFAGVVLFFLLILLVGMWLLLSTQKQYEQVVLRIKEQMASDTKKHLVIFAIITVMVVLSNPAISAKPVNIAACHEKEQTASVETYAATFAFLFSIVTVVGAIYQPAIREGYCRFHSWLKATATTWVIEPAIENKETVMVLLISFVVVAGLMAKYYGIIN